jgi:hypothetical protein
MFTELVQDTRAAVTLEFAPRLPPWSRLPNDHGAASRLRYAATRAGLLAGRSRAARIKLALLSVFWPAKATYDAVAAVVTYGSRVKAMSGIGRWRQWWGAMTLAHAWNFSPKTYYMYRLWDPAIRPSAPTFLQIHELLVLQMIVKGDMDTQVISSKATFAARCAAAGIPTPTVVATLARDAEEWTGERGALPRRDLFIKRVNGTQGIGASAGSMIRRPNVGLGGMQPSPSPNCSRTTENWPAVTRSWCSTAWRIIRTSRHSAPGPCAPSGS